jgi:acyl-CoA thioesterase
MTISKEFFKNDRFAAASGIELIEIREGYGKAKMEVTTRHLNAGNTTQGGAIFTLADLALAAASNSHGTLALSITSGITFLHGSGSGDTLYAEASERHCGKHTGHYQVDVTNQNGTLIATFEASVYRMDVNIDSIEV